MKKKGKELSDSSRVQRFKVNPELGTMVNILMNPLYPALKRLPFSGFCNPARDRNPAKGKPLLRQGTDGNRSLEGDISLNSLTEAPVVFSAFAMGETPAPERSEGERGGGRTSPMSKALRKQGAEV